MKIPDVVTKHAAKHVLKLQKHAPHILFGTGIAGVVTGTVLACRATLKVGDKLDEINNNVEAVKRDALAPYLSHRHDENYRKHHQRGALTYVYTRGGVDIAKLYAPAVIVGGVGIACLTGSHVVLTRRNNALTSAYVVLSKAFTEYRDRVRAEVGEDREEELYLNGKFVTETNVDGTKTKVLEQHGPGGSIYGRLFDDCNRHWQPDAELNRFYIMQIEAYFNDLLSMRGHVFLNEVYDQLGLDRAPYGQKVGWLKGSANGDNYIDFGIREIKNSDFMAGRERSVWLDFNVDGEIYNLI